MGVPFKITLPNGVVLDTESTEIQMFSGQELLQAIFSQDPSASFDKLLEPVLAAIPEEVDFWTDPLDELVEAYMEKKEEVQVKFEEEATKVLDKTEALYRRLFIGQNDKVLTAEEKTEFLTRFSPPVLDEQPALENPKSFSTVDTLDADGTNYVKLWEELKPKIEKALDDLQNPLTKDGKRKTKAMLNNEQPLKNLMAADLNKSVGNRYDANDIKTIYLERTKGKYRNLLSNNKTEVKEESNIVFVLANLAYLLVDQDQNKCTFTIVKELPKTGRCLTQENEIRPCKEVLLEEQSTGGKLAKVQANTDKALALRLAEERLATLEADKNMAPAEKANRLRNARARLEACH